MDQKYIYNFKCHYDYDDEEDIRVDIYKAKVIDVKFMPDNKIKVTYERTGVMVCQSMALFDERFSMDKTYNHLCGEVDSYCEMYSFDENAINKFYSDVRKILMDKVHYYMKRINQLKALELKCVSEMKEV